MRNLRLWTFSGVGLSIVAVSRVADASLSEFWRGTAVLRAAGERSGLGDQR